MGLEEIVRRILRSAEKERAKIIGESERALREKKSSAEQEARAEAERILEEGKREAKEAEGRILASARLKARRLKLETQEKLIQEVFSRANDELTRARESERRYKKILEGLVESGGVATGGGELEVQILKKDEKFLPKSTLHKLARRISKSTGIKTSLRISATLKNVGGGVVVQKADGSVKCDNTFEARLGRMRRSLRNQVARILFKS
ncbi:MAG: hypothetical protein J7J17_00395 [Hadesarchaea archaeon]|nr:hypothetical protein [Hadesarchaea archaeon]